MTTISWVDLDVPISLLRQALKNKTGRIWLVDLEGFTEDSFQLSARDPGAGYNQNILPPEPLDSLNGQMDWTGKVTGWVESITQGKVG